MTAPFAIPITCAACAGPLELVNATVNGKATLSIAILECAACEREWEVTARMVPHGPSRAAVERAEAAKQADRERRRGRRGELVPA